MVFIARVHDNLGLTLDFLPNVLKEIILTYAEWSWCDIFQWFFRKQRVFYCSCGTSLFLNLIPDTDLIEIQWNKRTNCITIQDFVQLWCYDEWSWAICACTNSFIRTRFNEIFYQSYRTLALCSKWKARCHLLLILNHVFRKYQQGEGN